jgi:hypothetical protein
MMAGSGDIRELSLRWEEHPYLCSFLISVVFLLWVLFFTPSFESTEEYNSITDTIQFIDIQQIETRAPRRMMKRSISDDGEFSADDLVERASGLSDDANAVDLAYYPSIAPPRPIGRLKKIYPAMARQMDVEAIMNVELLIAAGGRVKRVTVLGVKLSKEFPAEIKGKLSKLFARDAIRILRGAQFTPPVINGKRVPVKMEMPLRFRLD